MPRHAHPWGLGHLLLASPDCTIAALNLPLQAKQARQVLIWPQQPLQQAQHRTVNLGSAADPVGTSLARSTSSGPCLPYLLSPTSRLYLAPSSAPHNCIQPYLGTFEPRDLTASSRYSPEKHWSTPSPCDSRQIRLSLEPEHAVSVVEQLSLARVKLCPPMSQNVSATCTADVTAPLANSSPKSRLAIAVEPPDQPPRYPPPDRFHSQGPPANCREPPLRFRLHIRP